MTNIKNVKPSKISNTSYAFIIPIALINSSIIDLKKRYNLDTNEIKSEVKEVEELTRNQLKKLN